MKFRIKIAALLLLFWAQAFAGQKKITILLDAGHGGIDSGAVGKKSLEKNLNLKITKIVGKELAKAKDKYDILYTRDSDVFIELIERSDKARAVADIFVSIHCNSCKNNNARGAETYIMSISQLTATSESAKRENAVVLLEQKYKENYPNFDSTSSHSHILYELQNHASHQKSLELAALVQEALEQIGLKNRGVKQDRFFLFYRILVPCVLIEVGYISNSEEEKFLNDDKNIKNIGVAIASAIETFVQSYK